MQSYKVTIILLLNKLKPFFDEWNFLLLTKVYIPCKHETEKKKNPAVPVNLLHVFHKVSQMKGQWNNFEHVFISEWCVHKSNNKIMLWIFGVKNYHACSFEVLERVFKAWKFIIFWEIFHQESSLNWRFILLRI